MKDASEEEQEEDFISKSTKNSDPLRSKSARAEQLRKMMEEDGKLPSPFPLSNQAKTFQDEEMDSGGETPVAASQDSTAPLDAPSVQAERSPVPPVVVGGGRRRGRRKVMKKKTIKDEEGYLGPSQPVTSQIPLRADR